MQTNILWSGIEYYSLENCMIDIQTHGIKIDSVIVGLYQDSLYRLTYTLELDSSWKTHACRMDALLNNQRQQIELLRKNNQWFLNGTQHPEFDACQDIDIPLTPLTNSLPINRLELSVNQQQTIDVIYIDLLQNNIKPVKQKYQRTAKNAYRYENIPNDFEADILVDEAGFVIDYPQLFKRTVSMESQYEL